MALPHGVAARALILYSSTTAVKHGVVPAALAAPPVAAAGIAVLTVLLAISAIEQKRRNTKLKEELSEAQTERGEMTQRVKEVEEELQTTLHVKDKEHAAALQAFQLTAQDILVAQEEAKKAAQREAEKAMEEERQVRQRLMEGVRPELWPTQEAIKSMKRKRQYVEGQFHFAIAGVSGCGKSSLINALLRLLNKNSAAALTDVVEATSQIGRYPDSDSMRPFIWYDIPGAGTQSVSDWQYFIEQGLYIFDCIIVLINDRFTTTEIEILKNCARFKIPSYIVRSKSDQHIRNMAIDNGLEDLETDEPTRQDILHSARLRYINKTRQTVMANLRRAGLPDQKVYMVSNVGIYSAMKLNPRSNAIDEKELLEDIFSQAHARRCA